LQGNSGHELLSYLIENKNIFVVTGLPWQDSVVDLPVFVSHPNLKIH
jgi:hypothetical protein